MESGMSASKLTPAMQQFMRIKGQFPDAILFFRMGDFYETFFEDAKIASRVLGIALTSRSKGENFVPMAGVPYHAARSYIQKLIQANYKVAVCEQMEDPALAKGLVDRDVVQVVTPGTVTDEDYLDRSAENFLAAVALDEGMAAVAWVELSTGKFMVQELLEEELADAIARVDPRELLLPEAALEAKEAWTVRLAEVTKGMITRRPDWVFAREVARKELTQHFGTLNLEGFGCEDLGAGVSAAGALIHYLHETQRAGLSHIRRLERFRRDRFLLLDRATRRSLELTETMRTGIRHGSLLWVLDETATPMGGRLLREWILHPLRSVEEIVRRQEAVAELFSQGMLREELREVLGSVHDIERICARVACLRATPRDLLSLSLSLAALPRLRAVLEAVNAAVLAEIRDGIGHHRELVDLLSRAISPDAPHTLRDGGIFRQGYNAELDELREVARGGKEWITRFQGHEAARAGIPSLRVGFNKVFGYYIEVTNTYRDKVPDDYVRKQTLVNAERYITPELKEHESRVLSADSKSKDLEHNLFVELRERLVGQVPALQASAQAVAALDALADLAHVAARSGYVRPQVNDDLVVVIRQGRHPVLEKTLLTEPFVPNDTDIGGPGRRLAIITGPNMAGKSTYIRQVALLVLMAQMGSFIPAAEAAIGVADRVFTRVGASDELFRGQSTFMVEMIETANILNNATAHSLLVLDEVGRGTSTFDGLAIAWAVSEYLHERTQSRTLFATHYHELTELALLYPNVVNLNIAVREWKDEIVFLHKIVEGGTDKSYGIYVARLAGVPSEVLDRARQILDNLEANELDIHDQPKLAHGRARQDVRQMQLTLFTPREERLVKELAKIDPDRLTPVEALLRLKELRDSINGESDQ